MRYYFTQILIKCLQFYYTVKKFIAQCENKNYYIK